MFCVLFVSNFNFVRLAVFLIKITIFIDSVDGTFVLHSENIFTVLPFHDNPREAWDLERANIVSFVERVDLQKRSKTNETVSTQIFFSYASVRSTILSNTTSRDLFNISLELKLHANWLISQLEDLASFVYLLFIIFCFVFYLLEINFALLRRKVTRIRSPRWNSFYYCCFKYPWDDRIYFSSRWYTSTISTRGKSHGRLINFYSNINIWMKIKKVARFKSS